MNIKEVLSKGKTITFLVIIVSYFFVSFNQYKDEKVNMGGDNVAYFLLAKSLLKNKEYIDDHQIKFDEKGNEQKVYHSHYPPGYSAILAVGMYFFGNELEVAKNINGFFLLGSSILLFFLLKKLDINETLAFISSIFILHNYHILYFSMYTYSEVSFMIFFLLFLFSYFNIKDKNKFWKSPSFYISIFSIIILFYIKTMALGVLGGLVILLLIERRWKMLFGYLTLFFIFYTPWIIRNSKFGGGSYVKQLLLVNPYRPELGQMEFIDWFTRFWMNFKRYLSVEIPDSLIPTNPLFNYKTEVPMSGWIIGSILVCLIIFGLIKLKKHNLFMFLIIAGVFGILLFWPDVWFGKRFITPLIPILTALSLYGAYSLIEILLTQLKVKQNAPIYHIFPVFFLLVFPLSSKTMEYMSFVAENELAPKYKNYFDAAEWIKNNTSDSSITICRKPNLFHLYSEKKVSMYLKDSVAENLLTDFDKKKVTHVIIESLGFSSTGRYLVPTLTKYGGKFKQVYKLSNPDTYVFEYKPTYGYTGEMLNKKKQGEGTFKYLDETIYEGTWKNNERNGMGTYTWPNKTKFVGNWKSNKRNGEGVLYLPNGNIIKTIWENDIMNGRGEVYDVQANKTVYGSFTNNNFTPDNND